MKNWTNDPWFHVFPILKKPFLISQICLPVFISVYCFGCLGGTIIPLHSMHKQDWPKHFIRCPLIHNLHIITKLQTFIKAIKALKNVYRLFQKHLYMSIKKSFTVYRSFFPPLLFSALLLWLYKLDNVDIREDFDEGEFHEVSRSVLWVPGPHFIRDCKKNVFTDLTWNLGPGDHQTAPSLSLRGKPQKGQTNTTCKVESREICALHFSVWKSNSMGHSPNIHMPMWWRPYSRVCLLFI